jgi:ribosomal protein L33
MSPSFFADGTKFFEPLKCDKCGDHAYVIRRTPHPDIPRAEIQTFECPKCGRQTQQSTNDAHHDRMQDAQLTTA